MPFGYSLSAPQPIIFTRVSLSFSCFSFRLLFLFLPSPRPARLSLVAMRGFRSPPRNVQSIPVCVVPAQRGDDRGVAAASGGEESWGEGAIVTVDFVDTRISVRSHSQAEFAFASVLAFAAEYVG